MLDEHGYRPNVGIILLNAKRQVFWGKRVREHAWQFPQGGIKQGEDAEQAMYRELAEETGLQPHHVEIIGKTRDWLHYDVPDRWVRREWRGHYRGQKQIWFLLKMLGQDSDVSLRNSTEKPEFDAWRWHDFWIPLESVIEFKRDVYRSALDELSRLIFSEDELLALQRKTAEAFARVVNESVQTGLEIAANVVGAASRSAATGTAADATVALGPNGDSAK